MIPNLRQCALLKGQAVRVLDVRGGRLLWGEVVVDPLRTAEEMRWGHWRSQAGLARSGGLSRAR